MVPQIQHNQPMKTNIPKFALGHNPEELWKMALEVYNSFEEQRGRPKDMTLAEALAELPNDKKPFLIMRELNDDSYNDKLINYLDNLGITKCKKSVLGLGNRIIELDAFIENLDDRYYIWRCRAMCKIFRNG